MGRWVALGHVCLVLGVGALCFEGRASGTPSSSRCEQLPDCRRRMLAGQTWLNKGRLEQALFELNAAYQMNRDYALFSLLGQVHQRMGNSETALEFYRRYLKEAPADAPDRNHILQATTALIMAAPLPPEPPESASEPALPDVSPKQAPILVPPNSVAEVKCRPPSHRMPSQRIAGWALVGAGGALAVPAIALAAIDGKPASGQCDYGLNPWTDCKYSTTPLFSIGFALAGASIVLGTTLLLLPPIGHNAKLEDKETCADSH